MKISTLLATLGVMISAARAQFPPPPADTKYYYFRTSVQAGQESCKSKYDKLYVVAYHTGAGLSDATLTSGGPLPGHRGWFNGTYLNWFQPTKTNAIYFGVKLVYDNPYSAWHPVEINGGQQITSGFSLDAANKLLVSGSIGWLVCDWAHGVPQLFYQTSQRANVTSSCAKVDLVAELAPPLNTTAT